MNEAPKTTGQDTNDTFAPKTNLDSNPFTPDMKGGDFASNFGTNTNAVSQIFKEGGFGGANRNRLIILGSALLVVLGVAAFMLSSGDLTSEDDVLLSEGGEDFADEGGDDFIADEELGGEGDLVDGIGGDIATKGSDTAIDEDAEFGMDEGLEAGVGQGVDQGVGGLAAESAAPVSYGGSGTVRLVSPVDGAQRPYDETTASADFQWEGGPATIVFSRSQTMQPVERQVKADGSFRFHHPYPGTWYWQVMTDAGASEVRSFVIQPPMRRNIMLSQPQSGGTLAGEGGVVTWTEDKKVTHYRVELSMGSWANPDYRFATAGTSVSLSGVAPGQYNLRVGAFSEVSGRWEYTTPVPVAVQ